MKGRSSSTDDTFAIRCRVSASRARSTYSGGSGSAATSRSRAEVRAVSSGARRTASSKSIWARVAGGISFRPFSRSTSAEATSGSTRPTAAATVSQRTVVSLTESRESASASAASRRCAAASASSRSVRARGSSIPSSAAMASSGRPVRRSARPRSTLASLRRTGSALSATGASTAAASVGSPSSRWQRPRASAASSLTSASSGSSETWPSGTTALSHWFSLESARPLSTSASSTYLLSGCRVISVSARVTTWPQRLVASKVRPSRSAFRAELARRLVLYMPL